MKRSLLPALLATAVSAYAADLVAYERAGGRVSLRLSQGAADVTWIADDTFRFRRTLDGPVRGSVAPAPNVELAVQEEPAALLLSTNKIRLRILKRNLLLAVTDSRGVPLLTDQSPIAKSPEGLVLRRAAPENVRYYGLGARADASLDARGLRIETTRPFLMSSAGYAEHHVAPGRYIFDIAREQPGAYSATVQNADTVDFYFYYGPTPKDILEARYRVNGPVPPLPPSRLRPLAPTFLPKDAWIPPRLTSLTEYIRSIVHASMSGVLLPVFDVALFEGPLTDRAAQLGALAPLVMNGRRNESFIPFLLAYAEEVKDRGFPMIHPLPMQYPADPEAHRYSDEFLLGDELLLAPILTTNSQRQVYLPMGNWTRMRTNQSYPGRQTISIDAAPDELPMFVRNGAILPLLQAPELMHLHYFPRLGAEFFIYEPDISDYSQVHAAPASDDLRLEIESKKSRSYRWIVHHSNKPSRVASGSTVYMQEASPEKLRAGTWHWDATTRNLLVQTGVDSQAARIINVSF